MDLEAKLKKFIEDKGIDYKETRQSWVIDCISPACGKESHMYVRRRDGLAKCFKCGSGWNWRRFVADLEGCKPSESWNVLFKGQSGNSLNNLDINLETQIYDDYHFVSEDDEPYIELSNDFQYVDKSDAGMEYLCQRGVTDPKTILALDIRWHEGMQAVVFPISRNGLTYGWQARKINPKPDEPRLLTKTGFNKSKHLLNYDNAKDVDSIVLVEGPFDCAKIVQAGFSGAVCSFGKEVSQKQIEMLIRSNAKRIYVGLDPDAYKEADKVMDALLMFKEVFRVNPPNSKKDFGECSVSEIQFAVDNATKIESKASNLEILFRD